MLLHVVGRNMTGHTILTGRQYEASSRITNASLTVTHLVQPLRTVQLMECFYGPLQMLALTLNPHSNPTNHKHLQMALYPSHTQITFAYYHSLHLHICILSMTFLPGLAYQVFCKMWFGSELMLVCYGKVILPVPLKMTRKLSSCVCCVCISIQCFGHANRLDKNSRICMEY